MIKFITNLLQNIKQNSNVNLIIGLKEHFQLWSNLLGEAMKTHHLRCLKVGLGNQTRNYVVRDFDGTNHMEEFERMPALVEELIQLLTSFFLFR